MSFEITIEAEPGRTVSATLSASNPRVIVGRKKAADLTTVNRTVSREHAEFSWADGEVAVRDLDSTAGTFINGKRVQRGVLGLGDSVTCGKLAVTIRPLAESGEAAGGGTAVLDAFEPFESSEPPPPAKPSSAAKVDRAARTAAAPEITIAAPEEAPPAAEPVSQSSRTQKLGEPKGPESSATAPTDQTPHTEGFVFSFVDSDGTTGSFEVGPGGAEVILGRGKAASVRVKHRTVSRKHCAIVWVDGKAQVTDLQSSAGTYFRGRKFRRQLVGDGDTFAVGKLEVQVSAAAAGASPQAPSAQAGPWTMVFKDIEGKEHRHQLGPGDAPITIGRGKAATIRIRESTAGRQHCEVSYVNGGLVVRDLESRNGTFVNDVKITRHTLEPGDTLRCGSFPVSIEGPVREGAIEGWEENWDEDWTDVNEMSPPSWHLLYLGDEGSVEHESLDPQMRILAVGSDPDCEICVQDRGVEADHCEITWEEGILVAADLKTEAGTVVRGKTIDEKVLRNGDVVLTGDFRLHVVRGAPNVPASRSTKRGEEARTWSERFEEKDSSLCIVYCYGDEDDPSYADIGKVELTLWADGEARVEVSTEGDQVRSSGRVHEGVVSLVFKALSNAGYPVVPASGASDEACPVEISAYLDDYEVTALISHKHMNRIEPYREAIELLRAIAYELECSAGDG